MEKGAASEAKNVQRKLDYSHLERSQGWRFPAVELVRRYDFCQKRFLLLADQVRGYGCKRLAQVENAEKEELVLEEGVRRARFEACSPKEVFGRAELTEFHRLVCTVVEGVALMKKNLLTP